MPDRLRKGDREHFGKGRLSADPSRSVFINCPYDEELETNFDANTVRCAVLSY